MGDVGMPPAFVQSLLGELLQQLGLLGLFGIRRRYRRTAFPQDPHRSSRFAVERHREMGDLAHQRVHVRRWRLHGQMAVRPDDAQSIRQRVIGLGRARGAICGKQKIEGFSGAIGDVFAVAFDPPCFQLGVPIYDAGQNRARPPAAVQNQIQASQHD